ncbi:PLP-dependent aminotransferase family protein [Nocardioidaceae bacterium]|nr:PLP-dependent aminotransferase family protein [Nocardioidaceae bacterium]
MASHVSASRLRLLLGEIDTDPAYLGLADAVVRLIVSGRVENGARLPSERDLVTALGLSRTTVSRAYQVLRDRRYAESRHGSGTYARVPEGHRRRVDRTLMPQQAADGRTLDLSCATAVSADQDLVTAMRAAVEQVPAYLDQTGYFPSGLPDLQAALADRYAARGLPTTPEQIIITPGALAAVAVIERWSGRPGTRTLVEDPSYPNCLQALRSRGARLVTTPVDPDGWDLEAFEQSVRTVRPDLAYLLPDFHNPTGLLLDDDGRARMARALREAGTLTVVDEAHVDLRLDETPVPSPFATHLPDTLTVGSVGKSVWGGLRLGWIRSPVRHVDGLVRARVSLDLGAAVLEQLVLRELLSALPVGTGLASPAHLGRIREARDRFATGLRERLPSWEFRTPGGGLSFWVQLPHGSATDLVAAAEARDVLLVPGPTFSAHGGFADFVRLPFGYPLDQIDTALDRLVSAWSDVERHQPAPLPSRRITIA